jgi:hypothetical protein
VLVTSHEKVRLQRLRALEDAIVVRVLLDYIELNLRSHMFSDRGKSVHERPGLVPKTSEISSEEFGSSPSRLPPKYAGGIRVQPGAPDGRSEGVGR